MADRLRSAPGKYGLVLANGGWMTKEAVGVWSTDQPEAFTPVAPSAKPSHSVTLLSTPTEGVIETYTVTYGKGGPMSGIIFARTGNDERFIAIADESAMPRLLEEESPVGLKVEVSTKDEVNTFSFA